jgi:16S rRNA (guanine527-N7)-methyltransferase
LDNPGRFANGAHSGSRRPERMGQAAASLELIRKGAAALGLELGEEQLQKLERHLALLAKWNKTINLTAITSPEEMVEKHIVDSLAVAQLVPRGTLLDAGSGAGFPGVPIRIARPDVEVILVDSVQKKVAFLKNLLAELRLGSIRAQAVRLGGDPPAEGLPRVHGAVARAFAAPAAWLQLAEPYVLPGGLVLCMLGPRDEVVPNQGELTLERDHAYTLPFSGARRRVLLYRRRP